MLGVKNYIIKIVKYDRPSKNLPTDPTSEVKIITSNRQPTVEKPLKIR